MQQGFRFPTGATIFSLPPSPYRHRIQPNFLAGGLSGTSVATWQVLARYILLVCIKLHHNPRVSISFFPEGIRYSLSYMNRLAFRSAWKKQLRSCYSCKQAISVQNKAAWTISEGNWLITIIFFISETFLPILHPIKSVETAYQQLIVRDEKTLDQQGTALGILIDIEGGLITPLLTPCVLLLSDLGLTTPVSGALALPLRAARTRRNLMDHFWGLRFPEVARREAYCRRSCGAFLFELIARLNRDGVNTQCYADDICLLAVAKFPNTASGLMQWACHTVQIGCGEVGLSANPDKTEFIFTRKRYFWTSCLWN